VDTAPDGPILALGLTATMAQKIVVPTLSFAKFFFFPMSDVFLLTGRNVSSELRFGSRHSGPLSLPVGVDRPGDC
jgi:hypothetical protein